MSYIVYILWILTFWKPLYFLAKWGWMKYRSEEGDQLNLVKLQDWFVSYWNLVSWHTKG